MTMIEELHDYGLRWVVNAIEHNIIRVIADAQGDIDYWNRFAAIMTAALELDWPFMGIIDRGQPKQHGTGERYEGHDIVPGRTWRLE